ncbi:MAG: hypothetical protein Q9174_004661 [Haloplaca sp. 1 TL-2023]
MPIFQIDVEAGPYHPGLQVSGTVKLQDLRTYHVDFLNVVFSGSCEVKLAQGTHLHTGVVQLFQYEQRLLTGPYTLEGPCQWPFEFTFPEQCNTRSDLFSKNASATFNEDARQPLPQSFWFISDNINGSTAGLTSSGVDYKLEATLAMNQRTNGILQTFEFLTLTRPRNEQNPEPRLHSLTHTFTVQNTYLLPDLQARPPSLGEKLKYKVSPNKLPMARFVLWALLPTVGVLEQPLPLSLGVSNHDEHQSSSATTSAIYLRGVSVTLVSTTTVRCPSASAWSSHGIVTQSVDNYVLAIKDFSNQDLQMIDSLDIGALMGLRIAERDGPESPVPALAPSFKTFNIVRKYALNVHVTIECAKENFSREFRSSSFRLLAAECDSPVVSPLLRAPTDEEDGIDEEPPPSYEVAIKA